MEKLETLSRCIKTFVRKRSNHCSTKKLFDSGIQDRTKRFHTSSPSSPIRKEAAQKSHFRPERRQILKPLNSMNALAELPCHEELILPIGIQPKKITSSIDLRFTIIRAYMED